jgi:hypothetical protein
VIKGVNLGSKQAHKNKKNVACFMVINTILHSGDLRGVSYGEFKLRYWSFGRGDNKRSKLVHLEDSCDPSGNK